MRDLRSGELLQLPPIPNGIISSLTFSHDGRRLAFFLARPTQPSEIFVIDLDTRLARQLTESFLGGLNPDDLVTPRLIHFPTFDGRQIPAFLYEPKEKQGKTPVVLSIHGGPEAQERPIYLYSGLYQYLLSRGIGVLAPNIRGSTGYGKSYQQLIHHDWDGGDLRDIETAAQYLRSLDWVDPERIGIFGGSYGGFATLSAVSHLPDLWAAGVDIVGPSNLITFIKTVPPWWQGFMDRWVGNPERDREFLIERWPITCVDRIKAPLFVIQGAQAPRVVKAESDQMVKRLRDLGRTGRYDIYEDEGHGFTRRENELRAFKATVEWLEQHMLTPGI